jgi:lysophospholipase L1-like esterase
MKTCWMLLTSLLLLVLNLHAQENKLILKNGDRVAFIGNSITHSGEFHPDIFLYYATRFPNEKIYFYNCGVSGDAANEILARMDSDVLVNKPTVEAFMVGMNDMVRGYKNGLVSENTYPPYYKYTSEIADRLSKYGCKLILELPSIYDQTSEITPDKMTGVNDALGKCAEYLKSIAPKYNAVVVDYWSILKEINEKEQQKDKKFSIIGNDRVHPGAVGHLVMAYQFLKTTGVPAYVSKMLFDAKTGQSIDPVNCEITIGNIKKNAVEFTALEKALPFPVKKEAAPALNLIPFTKDLNQEILQVKNLKKGTYDLLIDGNKVGSWSSDDLANGVNLAENTQTPQYKHALEVMKACDNYRKAVMDLRSIAFIEYKTLRDYKGPKTDADIRAFFDEKLKNIKSKAEHDYIKGQCDRYLVLKPKQAELTVTREKARDQVYEINKPVKHTFKLVWKS